MAGRITRAALAVALLGSAALGQEPKLHVREVLVLHHSHLDVGYTHPQPMLWELQREFLDGALKLLDETADWPEASQPRWTCEVTAQVTHWLRTATPADVARLEKYLRQGRLGISAFQYNTTPLCSAEQLARQLYAAGQLRRQFGVRINTANCHDVDGLPWPVTDLLFDSGVELLIMAVNLHLGGCPGPRPAVFRWQTPSGRELLVMNGEHYTMFDQWLHPEKNSLEVMQQGLSEYLRLLEQRKYPLDFIYLTSTHAPWAYDNSPPNPDVARLIRQWNEAGREPPIHYVTPEQLLARIRQIPRQSLPLVRGDWTDFWNFGAGSSAAETRLERRAKRDLDVVDLLAPCIPPDAKIARAAHRAWDDLILYDEHTWGAGNSLEHDDPAVTLQWQLKAQPTYEARALADYLRIDALDRLAGNPDLAQSQEGVLVVNPAGVSRRVTVPIPKLWRIPGKRLRTNRLGSLSKPPSGDDPLCGPVELAPFSWKRIPLSELKPVPAAPEIRVGDDFLESSDYRLTFDRAAGRITGLWDRRQNWQLLDTSSPWRLFQLVHEQPDPQVNGTRKAFFDRDQAGERLGVASWKPQWQALREGAVAQSCRVEQGPRSATLVIQSRAAGLEDLEQRITLSADAPRVELLARFRKLDVRTPEALYFTFPLNLPDGWRSHFDTAGLPVELDRDQLPGSSRDWVTVDSYVSVHSPLRGVTLYCPDAPLVQVGDFQFGHPHAAIERRAHPLLLAWPMNNYWDTNFRASQPGYIELRYALASHGPYDPARAARDAQAALYAPWVHPAITCGPVREGRLIEVTGPGVQVLHVKRADDGRGIICRLLNLGPAPVEAAVALPGTLESAALCSALEEDRTPLRVDSGRAHVPLIPAAITTVRLR